MRGSRMRHMPHPHHDGPPRHRARRGAIKGSLLKLLAERPMHGYELIGELEERTGGRWRPSPGSVYPTLAQLEDEGLVRSFDDDGRKRFELTDAGQAWLPSTRTTRRTPPWERSGVGGRGDMRRLGGEIFGQMRQLGRFGTPAQQEQARVILTRTRTELYAVLAEPPRPTEPDGDTDDRRQPDRTDATPRSSDTADDTPTARPSAAHSGLRHCGAWSSSPTGGTRSRCRRSPCGRPSPPPPTTSAGGRGCGRSRPTG